MFVLSSLLIIHSILLLHYMRSTILCRWLPQWIGCSSSATSYSCTTIRLLIWLSTVVRQSTHRFTHLTGDSFGCLALQWCTRTLLWVVRGSAYVNYSLPAEVLVRCHGHGWATYYR